MHGRFQSRWVLAAMVVMGVRNSATWAKNVYVPLITRFEQGGGVVSVQVAQVTQSNQPNGANMLTRFVVRSIDAEPVGKPFALKPGDSFTLRDVMAPMVGNRCRLFVMYNAKEKRFVLCGGGEYGLMGDVSPISPQALGVLRGLAMMDAKDRLQACRRLAVDSRADDWARMEALKQLELWYSFSSEIIPERAAVLGEMKKFWHDAPMDMSLNVRNSLDGVLISMDPRFYDSTERANFWMAKALEAIPQGNPQGRAREIVERGEIVRATLREMAYRRTPGVCEKLCQVAADKSEPLRIRICAADVLESVWLLDKTPDPRWIAAAQSVYPEALSSNDNEIVLLASDQIRAGLGLTDSWGNPLRRYYPNKEVRQALEAALPRMQAREARFTAVNDAYGRGRTWFAVDSLQQAIQGLPSVSK